MGKIRQRKIAELRDGLYMLEAKERAELKKTVCSKIGHDDYEKRVGWWECRRCGHVLITL